MNEIEMIKYISKVDPIDLMIRAKEAEKYLGEHHLDEDKVQDALAYALAAGVKLGVKAVLESKEE